ncbi:MAG: ABC transporter ATP-binding protein [Candidatus Sumerlaeota bacterium]
MAKPIVQLQNVKKVYDTGEVQVTALHDVTLTIEEGEYSVIMGPSGSGKSTLLNLLGCLDRPTEGRYLLGDDDVSELDDDALSTIRSKRLGFIFQSYNLIPQLTVLENIEVPLYYQDVPEKDARRAASAMATKLGLGERLDHRPSQLSGGQQQRVAIARSLAANPLVLLADEPTGNLDSVTGGEILEIFDELNDEGRTIIMVTHDDDIAHRAHRVIRILDGGVHTNTRQEKRRPKRVVAPAGGEEQV